MKYGFRVYSFEVGLRSRGKPIEFDATDENGQQMGTLLASRWAGSLKRAIGKNLDHRPSLRDVVADLPPASVSDPRLKIRDVSLIGSHLRVTMKHGKVGEFDSALNDNDDELSIVTAAASRDYRIDVYFPKSGKVGILVAEVVNRTSALDVFLAWLARLDAQDLGQVKGGDPEDWYRVRATQLGDPQHLRELLNQATSVKVRFQRRTRSARGRLQPAEMQLEVRQLDGAQTRRVAEQILSWTSTNTSVDAATNRMLEILGIHREPKDNTPFNMTEVRTEGVESTTVRPGMVEEMFTYPIYEGDLPPSSQVWDDKTQAKAQALSVVGDIQVSWP